MPSGRSASSALLVGLIVWLVSAEAAAYCLTASCADGAPGELCEPEKSSDCGVPGRWARRCIGFSMHEAGSAQVDLASAEIIMSQAFAAWTEADCGGDTPAIDVANLGSVACGEPEYNQQCGNANVIAFRDTVWPYEGQGSTLALTTVTYNLDTGEIFDADMEVNASEITLTIGDDNVVYDLRSILTHEAGHILGIAHSDVFSATMHVDYEPGETGLRTLDQDDVAAICAAYPPDGVAEPSCDFAPRRGLRSECGPCEEDGCGCHEAAAPTEGDTAPLVVALLLVGASLATRRLS